MRSLAATLRRNSLPIQSTLLQSRNSSEKVRLRLMLLGGHKDIFSDYGIPRILNPKFSTQSSVHGEMPSADYAKARQEDLESQFGHTLNERKVSSLHGFGPFCAVYRAAIISFHVMKLTIWQICVRDMRKRAVKFRETLVSLGPFYIKLGQALSTRPDIMPQVYCQELVKLQDQIPPFPTTVAIKCIESQLGMSVSKLFADISKEPVAAASLGQVYKAHLHSGELVAVKVQRPGMSHLLTLDALLFSMIGGQLKRFAKARKDLFVAVNEMVRHMFDEIDYKLEAKNAERFARLYSCSASTKSNNSKEMKIGHQQSIGIKIPKIYWELTRNAVLTMEWIDGIKLTDKIQLSKANLNRKQLLDEGLFCSLRQVLEVGFFHADPHPGNLVATKDGSLAYFDFGMMGDLPNHFRMGLIQVLVHFVNNDSMGLAHSFLSLGFIPESEDINAVSDALAASFGDGSNPSQDFQGIMNQLYDVMYEFNFCLPPDYALVIRALGSLEGTAKVLDPDFKVIESAYPFVVGRLLVDSSAGMRKVLGQLLICRDGSIRWNRLEKLIAAISAQASETKLTSLETSSRQTDWESFHMRAVADATEDLFDFILSSKGSDVRVFLLRDMVSAADTFLDFDKRKSNEDAMTLERLVSGLEHFSDTVSGNHGPWGAMAFRLAAKPEFRSFVHDAVLALYSSGKLNATAFVCISRIMRRYQK